MATNQELAGFFIDFWTNGNVNPELQQYIEGGGLTSDFEAEVAGIDPNAYRFCEIGTAIEVALQANPGANIISVIHADPNLTLDPADDPHIQVYATWVLAGIQVRAAAQQSAGGGGGGSGSGTGGSTTGGSGSGTGTTTTTTTGGGGALTTTPAQTTTTQQTVPVQTPPPAYPSQRFRGVGWFCLEQGPQTWSNGGGAGSGSGFRIPLWFGFGFFAVTMFAIAVFIVKAVTPPVGPLPPDVVTMPTPAKSVPADKAK